MIIYPAIDLRHGRCVRLYQGDPNAETVFGENPAEMARHWVNSGATWLHIVNLDGALASNQSQVDSLYGPSNILMQSPGSSKPRSKKQTAIEQLPINLRRLHEIRQAVQVPIQFGGGLRSIEDIEVALKLGADRVILGTVAVENPDLVCLALQRWGADRIVVGLDAHDGMVATHGWQKTSTLSAIDLGHHMYAMGVQRVLYTDVSRDGTLSGVNVEETARLGDTTGLQVIASGGVANLDDIKKLKAREHYNIEGVIVGQAIYTKKLDLNAAIEVGNSALTRRSAGIIPYRHTSEGIEFLLLFNLFWEQWQFPRGGVEEGESDIACAIREFQIETGLAISELHKESRCLIHYTQSIRECTIERTVIYYLAEVASGEVALGRENHGDAKWLNAEQTEKLLTETSPEQLPIYDSAIDYLGNLPQ